MTEGEDRVHSASLHTQPGAEQAVVALPGYYQAIADDIIASDDPVRLALDYLLSTFKSHVDGRDLLDELHPRKTLDIKRRVDGVETWFEGDWLSNVKDARDIALEVLLSVDRATTASSVGMSEANAPNPPPKEAEPWRHILDAPMDGSWIVVIDKYMNPMSIRWDDSVSKALPDRGPKGWVTKSGYKPDIRIDPDVIVGWVRLPSPPDQKKG